MPIITINTQGSALDWAARGVNRIAQNVLNLISTWRYEVAYNRTLGIDPSIIDKPAPVAAALYTAEVYKLVQEYEPRARVSSVRYNGITPDGNIDAEVVIEIDG